jgi:hypothetical protein
VSGYLLQNFRVTGSIRSKKRADLPLPKDDD